MTTPDQRCGTCLYYLEPPVGEIGQCGYPPLRPTLLVLPADGRECPWWGEKVEQAVPCRAIDAAMKGGGNG